MTEEKLDQAPKPSLPHVPMSPEREAEIRAEGVALAEAKALRFPPPEQIRSKLDEERARVDAENERRVAADTEAWNQENAERVAKKHAAFEAAQKVIRDRKEAERAAEEARHATETAARQQVEAAPLATTEKEAASTRALIAMYLLHGSYPNRPAKEGHHPAKDQASSTSGTRGTAKKSSKP